MPPEITFNLKRLRSMDSTGALTIADSGVVLAQARTRPFEVFTTENYVAPGACSCHAYVFLLTFSLQRKLDSHNAFCAKAHVLIAMLQAPRLLDAIAHRATFCRLRFLVLTAITGHLHHHNYTFATIRSTPYLYTYLRPSSACML